MENLALACEWGTSSFLVFSSNVFGQLVYYSHLLPLLISLLFGFFILAQNRRDLAAKILFFITSTTAMWLFSDLVLWATEKPEFTMFFWSITILFEPFIYALCLYFVYVLFDEKDISLLKKIAIFLPLLPTIIFTPTKLALIGFDFTNCDREAIQGILIYYGLMIEVFYVFWIVLLSFSRYHWNNNIKKRKRVIFSSIGVILFLFSFALGNIVGSLLENWTIGQYGLFGIPIFIAFLSYLIVKFRLLNIKLIGTQALIVTLWVMLFAVLFVRRIEDIQIIVLLTLLLFLIVGILLIRSVKREVEQREHIEKLAQDLEMANEKLKELDQLKSEFLSLATHQIRAPLTAIKGYSSMLLDGDFGVLPPKAKDSIETIMKSCQNLINIVGDFLNISRIEQGRMVYDKSVFEIGELVKEAVKEIEPNVQNVGLSLKIEIPDNFSAKVNADRNKIKQVIGNIIDNAIKYTVKGDISVSASADKNKAKIIIKDSGVGIDPSEINKLFAKFSRTKDANRTNITGTGLGLYIAKKMTEAHGGDIKVFSEGLGKGTVFTIELPINESQ